MKYLVTAESFAAPFCSDSSTKLVEADTPRAALAEFASRYTHPAGLYSAAVYASAEAYHEGAKPIAKWLSNHAHAIDKLTRGASCYSMCSLGPGRFELNGATHVVADPKSGAIR